MQPDVLISTIASAEVRPFRRTTPPHMHDDLEQEARIGVWHAMQQLDDAYTPQQQRAWLGRAARSKVLSYLRYVKVRRREVPGGEMFGRSDDGDRSSAGLLQQAMAAQRAGGDTMRPDAEVEALDLARRIDRAVELTLDALSPEARAVIEARLHHVEAGPQISRRRRDEHVRQACDLIVHYGRVAGCDVDLRPMISCR